VTRRALLAAAAVGAALLVAGIVAGFARRDADLSALVTVLLGLGTVLAAGSLVGAVLVERRPDGLTVPAGQRLPSPHWHGPLVLVGLCDLVGGSYASPPLAVVGALLAAAGLVGFGLALQRPPGELDRGTVIAARRLRSFVAEHPAGGEPAVALEHLGRGLTRLVVVAPDGAVGDVVVREAERGAAAAALAGLPSAEPASRELGAAMHIGRYEWTRMAGQQLSGGRPGGSHSAAGEQS
jgi:hypothetical protein